METSVFCQTIILQTRFLHFATECRKLVFVINIVFMSSSFPAVMIRFHIYEVSY